MAKTKVALVLSGGTSAGAYIAGALDELLRAFKASGEHEIDVIAGASAGATNAAIIAHGLCYRGGETDLREVWVEGVDIVELLAPDLGADDPVALLSQTRLRGISRETIAWPEDRGPGVRAPFCASDLRLAMTLANSTPLPYRSRILQPSAGRDEPFVQERSAEQETFDLPATLGPRDPLWERIGTVALASAAIPFVFPMVRLRRRADDARQYIVQPDFAGEREFWYYDGGTYNNLPIDLAWHYVEAAARSEGRDPREDRRIVVVNPWRENVEVPAGGGEYPGLLAQAFGLLRDIRTESSTVQFDNEVSRRLTGPGSSGSALEALPGIDRPLVDALGTFALVMPRPDQPPLRCVYLNNLSAFLDRRFREYDYRRGAADARRLIVDLLGITDYPQQAADFYAPDADPAERGIGDAIGEYAGLQGIPSTRDPSRTIGQVFEEALDRRIEAIVRRLDVPGPDNPLTDALVSALVKRFVRDRLPSLWNPDRRGAA